MTSGTLLGSPSRVAPSEVTLNVNLGGGFEQGELLFYGRTAHPLAHHDWHDGGGVGHGACCTWAACDTKKNFEQGFFL